MGKKMLRGIVMPDSVTRIASEAFVDCGALMEVPIPTAVTEIDMNAFYNCQGLAEIPIPEKVISIGFEAFRDCWFADIYFNAVNCTQGNSAF